MFLLPADLVAVPDFQSGAMENWGLTTYREAGLLFQPKSSASDKLGITMVIAHELAHQVPLHRDPGPAHWRGLKNYFKCIICIPCRWRYLQPGGTVWQ